jgi:hypothetical protein
LAAIFIEANMFCGLKIRDERRRERLIVVDVSSQSKFMVFGVGILKIRSKQGTSGNEQASE